MSDHEHPCARDFKPVPCDMRSSNVGSEIYEAAHPAGPRANSLRAGGSHPAPLGGRFHGIPTRAPVHVTLAERVLLATTAALVFAGCVVVTWRHLVELGVGR